MRNSEATHRRCRQQPAFLFAVAVRDSQLASLVCAIPIMIFTRSEWDADRQGRFGIGAGGFDEELWHNQEYVFAMSSRYNAADEVKCWEEVAEVVEQNKAAHRMPRLYPQ